MADIPSQRQRCATYEWCTATVRGHRSHVGEVHRLATARGTRLRVSLMAEDQHDPVVVIEAAFHRDNPLLEVAELEPAEAVELAGMFLRLARVGHGAEARENDTHNH